MAAPLVWFAAGVATLALGWPWLWLNPVENLGRYLASGTDRHAVHVFYLGRVWADHEAPWHYPLLMFLWTVPVGFLLLGAAGAAAWWGSVRGSEAAPPRNMPRGRMGVPARRRTTDKNVRPASTTDKNVHPTSNTEKNVHHGGSASSATGAEGDFALLALAGTFLLAVFAWPGVPVYDGVRLFLVVFPLWTVFAGLGAQWLVEGPVLRRFAYRTRVGGIGLLVASQAAGLLLYHPCQTSYYNVLVGGLRGADRMGLETTYWGDSVVEPMLAEAARRAPGRPVLFGPHLAPFQAPGVEMASSSLAEAETTLVGWDPGRPERAADCRYAVIYRRRADLAPVDWVIRDGQVVAEYRKQGVWLTRLVRLPSGPPPRQAEPGD